MRIDDFSHEHFSVPTIDRSMSVDGVWTVRKGGRGVEGNNRELDFLYHRILKLYV